MEVCWGGPSAEFPFQILQVQVTLLLITVFFLFLFFQGDLFESHMDQQTQIPAL